MAEVHNFGWKETPLGWREQCKVMRQVSLGRGRQSAPLLLASVNSASWGRVAPRIEVLCKNIHQILSLIFTEKTSGAQTSCAFKSLGRLLKLHVLTTPHAD